MKIKECATDILCRDVTPPGMLFVRRWFSERRSLAP